MATTDKKFVFRLQDETSRQHDLKNTLKHWEESRMFDDKQINAIKSSNAYSTHEPTSVPSPFARIALAKTAFAEVAEYGDKALAAYQKIVSDSLDVAELFFTFDKWEKQVEIIKWDKIKDLKALEKHTILHKTLTAFLDDDAEIYNFDKMDSIYILKHKTSGKMIGATSPCTMFFSSANQIEYQFELGKGDIAFDKDLCPLHKRSCDFQKYLYTWLKNNNETQSKGGKPVSIFNELQQYLEAQKKLPTDDWANKIDDIDNNLPNNFEDYDQLRAPDVEICGKPLHKWKISARTAPNYLTTKDLLAEKIIRLPYKIQKKSFFDGNLNETSVYSYLLPVKDKFFEKWTASELQKWIRINETGTVVEVKLEIPNLKQEIKKVYKESESMLMLESGFDCMLFPNIKFDRQEDSFYRFGMFVPFSQKTEIEKYSVDFFNGSVKVEQDKPVIRNVSDPENPICKTYSLSGKTFDRIKVGLNSICGVVLPLLPDKGVTENFTIAVDFGTTNTHIEYKTTADNNIRPLDVLESDSQISFLLGKTEGNTLVSDIDFIPMLIGSNKQFKFPVRTALSIAKNSEKSAKIYPFAQANLVVPYEKRLVPNYNSVKTQLKWDSTEDEMGYYIDSLCFILRNKVALNGGNLADTKIVWFYPLSMAGSRSKIIKEKWNVAYAKYFLGYSVSSIDDLDDSAKETLKKNIIALPESVAPFLCCKEDIKYKDAINDLVSIDIGGGTTDIVFIRDGKQAEYVTSFRFAANSIFGLGDQITPVVSKYQSEIEAIIEQNDPQFKLRNILKSITGNAWGDLASFFFSLSDNDMLKDVNINFNSMLKKDNNQKLVFVLFYAAIIYHSAQIMKAKNLSLPRHIAFSGNGSRIVNIVGDKDILAELSKLIFEKVFGQKYSSSGLEIIQNTKNPKEVTCQGGIKAADKDYKQQPFEPLVLLGIDNTTFVTNADTYSTVNVTDSVIKTNRQVKAFMEYVLDDLLQQQYKGIVKEPFVKALNINQQTILTAKTVLAKDNDLINFTKNGINKKIEDISDKASTKIEETFFFYPIESLLRTISNEINKM
jgi:hypothetical protein